MGRPKKSLLPKPNDYKKLTAQLEELRGEAKSILASLTNESKNLSSLEYIQETLYIKTKDARLIKLQLNTPQKKIYDIIQQIKMDNKPVRLIVLKARQEGVSTLTEALIFEDTSRRANRNSMIVAHNLNGSDHIFGMSKLFYEKLPEDEKPVTRYSSRKELDFADPLNARIQVDTAGNSGNDTVGRSFTIHNFHGSEVAFWSDAKTIMLGLMQAIPDHNDTMVVLESTANGVGGYFYDEYWRAKEGKSDFTPIFLPWFDMPEYSRELGKSGITEQEFIATMDDDEKALQKKHALSLEQLNWRRWAIENKCGGDKELFKQEYPSSDVEAFMVSGRPVFDMKKLTTSLYVAKKEIKRGYLIKDGETVEFSQNDKGYLKIWEYPEFGAKYCIGADIAEGLEKGDFSTAIVLDMHLRQMAEWDGHIDPDLFAEELIKLGTFYNDALIAPETNNNISVLNFLKQNYVNVFLQRSYDKVNDQWIQKPGWHTSLRTKPILIGDMIKAIREDEVVLNSKDLIKECMTYVLDEKGSANAQEGSFDDRVMAAMIGLQIHKDMPQQDYKVRNYVVEAEKKVNPLTELEKQWQAQFPGVIFAVPEPQHYPVRI